MIAELEELYRAKRPDFCRVAAAIAGERSLGEDAVQDAFAKAVRKRRSYRGRGSLEAWVWRIVVNAARDARRRRPLVVAPNELRLTETNGRSDGRAVPPTAPLHRGRLGAPSGSSRIQRCRRSGAGSLSPRCASRWTWRTARPCTCPLSRTSSSSRSRKTTESQRFAPTTTPAPRWQPRDRARGSEPYFGYVYLILPSWISSRAIVK
jgi:RNA polymerase sigma factor (sigma-70 family)